MKICAFKLIKERVSAYGLCGSGALSIHYYFAIEGALLICMHLSTDIAPTSLMLSMPALTLLLPQHHLKTTSRSARFEILKPFIFYALACERPCIKTHRTESRFVTGLENIAFVAMCAWTFQPGNLTGWGNEGVKTGNKCSGLRVRLEAM